MRNSTVKACVNGADMSEVQSQTGNSRMGAQKMQDPAYPIQARYADLERKYQLLEHKADELQQRCTELESKRKRNRSEQEPQTLLIENRSHRQYLETLIDALPIGIAVISAEDFRCEIANEYYRRTPISPHIPLDAKTVREPIPDAAREGERAALEEVVRTGKPVTLREVTAKAGGKPVSYWNVEHIPVMSEDGRVERIIVVAMEVTEMVQARKQPFRHAKQLQDANEELQSFVYSVSHDLRNPLNNIKAMSSVLQAGYMDVLDDDGKKCIDHIDKNISRMSDIIGELLKLSRISRTELKLTQVNFSKIARELLDELHANEPNRSVLTNIQEGLTFSADKRLIKLALDNLIRNAWKYTGKQKPGVIEIGSSPAEAGRIFYVKDNGVGFDMQHAEKIFNPFQRAHSKSQFTGTGIGLSIVKRIIERHNGRIWAISQSGKGATFFFLLPEVE
ncbi:MAG: PAS domain-containing protein [Chitinivibrionales bacterium]|nr:PAS domain-containing protein [Chitinivibrionales bacterium]